MIYDTISIEFGKICFLKTPYTIVYTMVHSALLGGRVRTFISEFFKFRASYYINFHAVTKGSRRRKKKLPKWYYKTLFRIYDLI